MDRLSQNRSDLPQYRAPINASPGGLTDATFTNPTDFEHALNTIIRLPAEAQASGFRELLARLPELDLEERIDVAIKLAGQTSAIGHDEQLTLLGGIIDLVEQSVAETSSAYRDSASLMLEWSIYDAMQASGAPNANFFAVHSQLLAIADRYEQRDVSALIASQMLRRLSLTPLAHREQDYKTLVEMIAEFRPEFRTLMFGALLKKLPEDPSDRLRLLELLDAQTNLLETQNVDTMEIQATISHQLYKLRINAAALEQGS